MMTIDPRLIEAHDTLVVDRARRGILDHTLDVLTLDGMSVEEAMREDLRRAGRLPVELEEIP